MARIVVIGTSGTGKSTLARRIGEMLDLPVVEMDALHHMPGWQERPEDEFRQMIIEATKGPRWVVDGNYSKSRDVVWPRAQMVIWLDYPRWRTMSRVIRRTVRRVISREELWHGNREPLSNLWSLDPEKSIIAWAWTTHASRRQRYERMLEDPRWSHIDFRRVRRPGDLPMVLAELGSWAGDDAEPPDDARAFKG